jgi:tRNA A37 threonylcarbamoyladenosine modification protein TsaB
MTLFIDTLEKNFLNLAIKKNDGKFLVKRRIKTKNNQIEKMLNILNKVLNQNGLKLTDLKKIEVKNGEGSFTSLRVGIIIANALAYALNIGVVDNKGKSKKIEDFSIVEPKYSFDVQYALPKKVI